MADFFFPVVNVNLTHETFTHVVLFNHLKAKFIGGDNQ